MKESESKYAKAFQTMMITGLAFLLNYGINLILVPFITDNIGTEAYGFVSLARQFAEYATIITAALNSFAARYIAVEYFHGEYKKANIYFSSVFWGDLIIGSVIFGGALVCIGKLQNLLNIPAGILTDVKFLFLFIFVNFWATTVFSVFASAAIIKNKLDIAGIFKGISYLTEAIILYILYMFFPTRIYYVGIGIVASSLVVVFSNIQIRNHYVPVLRSKKRNFSMDAVKRLVLGGIWTSVNSVGGLLNNGLDLLICNLMLSSVAMGQMAIAKMINSIFQALYTIVSQAFQPMFLKSYSEGKMEILLQELKFSMKISGMLTNVGFAGFIALGLVYYRLWIPGEDIYLIYKLTVITLLTCIPSGPMQPLYYIYTLTVKKMVPCFVTVAGGFFNVIGMYLLIKYFDMGIFSVVWTTAAVMMIINFVTNPLYISHVLHLPWYTFYPEIIRNVISCLVLICVFKFFSWIFMPEVWISLILSAIFYAMVGCPLHLCIVGKAKDWKQIMQIIKNLKKS